MEPAEDGAVDTTPIRGNVTINQVPCIVWLRPLLKQQYSVSEAVQLAITLLRAQQQELARAIAHEQELMRLLALLVEPQNRSAPPAAPPPIVASPSGWELLDDT